MFQALPHHLFPPLRLAPLCIPIGPEVTNRSEHFLMRRYQEGPCVQVKEHEDNNGKNQYFGNSYIG